MALKVVLGGTTGATDGTLVDSGHPIVFTAIDTPVDAHIRADDDTYAAPSQFVAATTAGPAVGKGDIQVSVDGGSTWHGWTDNPLSLVTGVGLGSVDLGDLNFPIKLRQHAASPPGDTSGSFDTDGTLAAATALSDVGSFAAASASSTSIAVSWAAVTNRTRYQVDRATNSGFTTGVTLGVYTGTGTSFTDTGLTTGTTYYYRIKAIGTYRFKDSANFATANGAPSTTISEVILGLSPLVYYKFDETSGTAINDSGSLNLDATVTRATLNQAGPRGSDKSILFAPGAAGSEQHVIANAKDVAIDFDPSDSFTVSLWWKPSTVAAGSALMTHSHYTSFYKGWDYQYLSSGELYNFRGRGELPPFDGYSDKRITVSLSAGTWYHIAYVCNGTNIKTYLNGTLIDTWTPTNFPLTPTDSTGRLRIGYTPDDTALSPDTQCNGNIAHPAIFGVALSEAEVQSIHDAA